MTDELVAQFLRIKKGDEEAKIAFLHDRLDEDERVARDAGGKRWTQECGHVGFDWTKPLPPGHDNCCVVDGPDIRIYDEGGHSQEQAAHIARFSPARMLAEVTAKRLALARIEHVVRWEPRHRHHAYSESCAHLAVLVSSYADHEDFKVEWR